MGRSLLVRTALFPAKIYSDFHVVMNDRSIRNGKTSWPQKSLYDIVWIHPDEVIGSMYKQDRIPTRYRGRLLDGDWDLKYKKVEETTAFKVLDLRLRKKMEWEEIFRDYCLPHGFLDEKQIRKYREKATMRDETYRNLKESGWTVSNNKKKSLLIGDELTVNMTREGRYLRNNSGMHRLVMARFLGLDRIPCLIHVVHKDFFSKHDKLSAVISDKSADSDKNTDSDKSTDIEKSTDKVKTGSSVEKAV